MKLLPFCAKCGKEKGNCRHDGGLYLGRKQSMVRHEFEPAVSLKEVLEVLKNPPAELRGSNEHDYTRGCQDGWQMALRKVKSEVGVVEK